MKESMQKGSTIIFESVAMGTLSGAVTAMILSEFIFGVIAFIITAGLIIAAIIYYKKHPAKEITEKEKADENFMKKAAYEKSSLLTLRIILYIFSAAFGVILTALIYAHYMVILFTAPFFITSLTIFVLNRVMFEKVDVTKKPDDKDTKKDRDDDKYRVLKD